MPKYPHKAYMGPLLFNLDADRQLTRLQADTRRGQLYDRINDVLDAIEDDPAGPAVRRRRYHSPTIWGVPVHGSGEDWLVLWSETEAGPLVHYIGEDLK